MRLSRLFSILLLRRSRTSVTSRFGTSGDTGDERKHGLAAGKGVRPLQRHNPELLENGRRVVDRHPSTESRR